VNEVGTVRTERLLLRPPRPEDVDDYRRIFLRPEVTRWLRPAPLAPLDAATVETILTTDLAHWQKHRFGQWAVTETESRAVVGRGGVCWTEVEGTPAVELAWTIDPDRHGEGFATELAFASVAFARERGIEELVAMTLPHNRASRRVAEKLGMEPAGDIVHAGLPHVLYRAALT
jgi:RimJ/RimL family protein N-acetyltransferase